jgi:hypothetical protein
VLWTDNENIGPLHVQTTDGVDTISPSTASVGIYAAQMKAFLEDAPGPLVDDALAAHRVLDAAYRSARNDGAPVTVEP